MSGSVGDWVGYEKYHPLVFWGKLFKKQLTLLASLRQNPGTCSVRGNHDIALLDGFESPCRYNTRASAALAKQRRQVAGSGQWQDGLCPWLRLQPYVLSPMRGVYMAHGTFRVDDPPRSACPYTPQDVPHERGYRRLSRWLETNRLESDELVRAVEGWDRPMILLTGHTHAQAVWQRPGAGAPGALPGEHWPSPGVARICPREIQQAIEARGILVHRMELSVSAERPVWINPGCVGDPRDASPRPANGWEWARYAVVDWSGVGSQRVVVHLRWVPYSIQGEERN